MSVRRSATKTSRSAPPEAGLRFGSGHHAIRSEDAAARHRRGDTSPTTSICPDRPMRRSCARRSRTRRSARSTLRRRAKMPGVLAVVTGRDLAADEHRRHSSGRVLHRARRPADVPRRDAGAGGGARPLCRRADRDRDRRDACIRRRTRPKPSTSASINSPPRRTWRARWPPDAPAIWPDAPGNIALDWEDGDAAAVDAAFARAAHVERVRLVDTRLAPSAMEPRAAIASFDASSQRYTLIAPTQGVAVVRKLLAEGVFKMPADRIRVADPRRGRRLRHEGAGLRRSMPPCCTRRAGSGGRSNGARAGWRAFSPTPTAATGCSRASWRSTRTANSSACACAPMSGIGAYTSTFAAIFATANTKNCLSSVYVIPSIHIGVKMVLTNAAPLGPYRGAGRPEAIYLIERLIDRAAQRHGHRSRRAAPAQPDPAGRDAVPDAERADLRQRRLRDHPGQGAGAGRLGRLRGAPRRVRARRQAARHRHRLLPRGRRRHSRREPSTCASSPTARWRCAPARRRWGRGISPRSCR